ncbi:hypothetical protein HGA34_03155 [Candidatus Falkowbacteria bacterium]|nr:hypothetical protein [Candidatus Falkowbacteria bacterium]
MQNDHLRRKLYFLIIYNLAANSIVYFLKPLYLWSLVIVVVLPSLIASYWLKHNRKKIFYFSLLSTLLFAPPAELMARLANAWDVQSIFPRVFGYIPLENIFFAFFNFHWVLTFYELFVVKTGVRKMSKRFFWLFLIYAMLSIVVYSLYFIDPSYITTPYHILAIPMLLIPFMAIMKLRPISHDKLILPTIFFAYIFFTFETVALQVGNWWWPSNYLLPINLFGRVFPLDDVIIWYFLSTPTLILGYEYFSNDQEQA